MNKKWNDYQIIDIEQNLLSKLPEDEKEKYKTKLLYKKQENIFMFSKKAFKKYRENHDTIVAGRIRKRQSKYKTYENHNEYPPNCFDEFIKSKRDKKITGSAKLSLPENISDNRYYVDKCFNKIKLYDVKEADNQHTVGYAYIGNDKFLQVTAFNPLLLLIPLLIAIILLSILHFCPSDKLPPLDIANGHTISDTTQPSSTEQLPNCDYLLFSEKTVVNKDNPGIRLCNLKSNSGLWLISYQIYIDGELLKDINNPDNAYTTGAIKAGFQIDEKTDKNLNLYERLDAGTYELKCVGTQYQETPNDKGEHLVTPVTNTLTTTLIVEK